MNTFFASKAVIMKPKNKKCNRCFKYKNSELQFYCCAGQYRPECKSCTIKRNVERDRYARKWTLTLDDFAKRKQYMKLYYQDNKTKYVTYKITYKNKLKKKELLNKKKNPITKK